MNYLYRILEMFIITSFAMISFSSCNNSNLNTHHEKQEIQTDIDKCLKNEFYKCVNNYIVGIDKKFIIKAKPFYSLYFFEKEDIKYFTIWAFPAFPDYIEVLNPKMKFNYYAFEINDKDLIIIEYDNSKERKLYSKCNKNINLAIKKRSKNKSNINYDGSWFPKTFKYEIENAKIVISISDTLIVDLLGADFLNFEEYIKGTE